MSSPTDAMKNPNHNLREQLERIGLRAVAAQMDDMLAHATEQRWSPRQLLEQLAQIEVAERTHRSLERRLRTAEIRRFKPVADFDWSWPTRIERDVVERALTLDFLAEARNLVLVGANGLGKTMIAQNICHAAVLAATPCSSAPLRRCWRNCIGRHPKDACVNYATTPTWLFSASMRSAISPSTTNPPTCSTRSSTAATNRNR